MKYPHEATIHDDAPTPEQLFYIASTGIVLAKNSGRLKKNSRSNNPKTQFMMPPTETEVPDLFVAPFGYRYEHTLSGRISRQIGRSWSMHFRFGHFVTDMGSGRGAERHTYSFRWDHDRVTLARHLLRVMPVIDRDMAGEIDAFAPVDELSGEWSWRTQLGQVAAGEVEDLAKQLRDFDWSGEKIAV